MWTSLFLSLSLVFSPVAATKKRAKGKKKAPITAPTTEQGDATPAPPTSAAEPTPAAEPLLLDADRARGGLKDGITWQVEISALEDEQTTLDTFLVKARDNDCLAEATAPPRRKGELLLFNDRTLWFFKPGVRKPVSISARQKLTGDAANGDIATTRYARDYDGKVVGRESLDGAPMWKLELTARVANVTYDRIRYWISVDRHLGMKAEFLSLQGEVLKEARFVYGNKVVVDGKTYEFVSTMTITDPSIPGNKTVLTFGPPRPEAHAATLFNINNVVR
jgi:Outer membrane lipoprotein-sorting protein